MNHWCASIPDLGDETPADWSLEPVDIDPPPLPPAELVDPIGPPPPLVCWYKLLLICWWFTLDILVHSSDQTPRLLSKFTLGVSFRLLNPFHFFFRTRSFAVVGLVSSKWNYFLDRLILSVWKGCEIVRCECAKTVFHSGSGRLTMNDESNIWLVSSTIKISFFSDFWCDDDEEGCE